MSKNSKRLNKGVVRIAIIILVIIIQICILALLAYKLKQNTIYLYTIFEAIGLVKVFKLINKYGKSPYTILWTIIILVIPVFGELLYFLWGKTELNGQKSKRMKEILLQTNKWLKNNSTVQSEFIINNSNRKRISNYLEYEGLDRLH